MKAFSDLIYGKFQNSHQCDTGRHSVCLILHFTSVSGMLVEGRDEASGRLRGEEDKSVLAMGFFSFLPELDQLFLAKHTSHICCRGGSVEKGLKGKNRSS